MSRSRNSLLLAILRRVLNLITYFDHQGKALPITDKPQDYQPGDIVAWRLDGGAIVKDYFVRAGPACLRRQRDVVDVLPGNEITADILYYFSPCNAV